MRVRQHPSPVAKGRNRAKRCDGQQSRTKARASNPKLPASDAVQDQPITQQQHQAPAPRQFNIVLPADPKLAAETRRACEDMTLHVAEVDNRLVRHMQTYEQHHRVRLAHSVRKKSGTISPAGRVMLGTPAGSSSSLFDPSRDEALRAVNAVIRHMDEDQSDSGDDSDSDDEIVFEMSPGAGLACGPLLGVDGPATPKVERPRSPKRLPQQQHGFMLRATAPVFSPTPVQFGRPAHLPVRPTVSAPPAHAHWRQHHGYAHPQHHEPPRVFMQHPPVIVQPQHSWHYAHPQAHQPQWPFGPLHQQSQGVPTRPPTPASSLSDDDDMVWEASTRTESDLCTTPGSSPYMSGCEDGDDFDQYSEEACATDKAMRALRLALQHTTIEEFRVRQLQAMNSGVGY